MGVDILEIVMEVEQTFGIKIPDAEAQTIFTVGELFECIKTRIDLAPAGTCLTAATFFEIRHGFQSLGINERFAPSTAVCEIAPDRHRRAFWGKLADHTKLRFPDLIRPAWIVVLNILITLTASLLMTALILSGQKNSGGIFVISMIIALFFVGWIMAFVTRPFATRFPTDCKTFRDLSERVLVLNATMLQNKYGPMGPNDIWVILRDLIVTQLGVDADEVTPEANFVNDLGC